MNQNIDIQILELLASKICHDLISPIGAVNNGVEFLEEMGAEAGEEITGLISFSAAQASAKLQAFRMAYGAGGADSALKPEDVHKLFEMLIGPDGKIRQDWDPHAPIGPEILPHGFCKILMACLLLAMECLPKGGTITVSGAAGSNQTHIKAQGENVTFKDRAEKALALAVDCESLGPTLIHAYVTGLLAKNYNFSIATNSAENDFALLTLTSPDSDGT